MSIEDPYRTLDQAFGPDGANPDGIVFHPRAFVTLKTVLGDDDVNAGFVPNHVALRRGSHNKASECEVDMEGAVLPFPIQSVVGMFLCVYLGVVEDALDAGEVKRDTNLRFCGFVDEIDQDIERRTVTLRATDLSRILREHRPLVKSKITVAGSLFKGQVEIDPTPLYSDTLEQAIRKIITVVPGFGGSSDPPLELRSTAALKHATRSAAALGATSAFLLGLASGRAVSGVGDLVLGSLVSGRAMHGPIMLKQNCSAWEAIEHVCGMAARHVSVDLREIVVRWPDEVFKDSDPDPDKRINFVIGVDGANAAPPKFHKKFIRNRKGVKVVAWDTEQRKQVSAVFPPDDELPPLERPAPTKIAPPQDAPGTVELRETGSFKK